MSFFCLDAGRISSGGGATSCDQRDALLGVKNMEFSTESGGKTEVSIESGGKRAFMYDSVAACISSGESSSAKSRTGKDGAIGIDCGGGGAGSASWKPSSKSPNSASSPSSKSSKSSPNPPSDPSSSSLYSSVMTGVVPFLPAAEDFRLAWFMIGDLAPGDVGDPDPVNRSEVQDIEMPLPGASPTSSTISGSASPLRNS